MPFNSAPNLNEDISCLDIEARLASAMPDLQAGMSSSKILYQESSDLASASSFYPNIVFGWMQLKAAGSIGCYSCTGCPRWQISSQDTDDLVSASSFNHHKILTLTQPSAAGSTVCHICTGCPQCQSLAARLFTGDHCTA